MRKPFAGSDGKQAALLISPEAPYPPVGGGALRAASMTEYLGRRYDLDLVLFREPGGPDPASSLPPGLARRVLVVPLPYHSRGVAARAARNLWRMLRSRPPLNDRFEGFGAAVRAFVEGRRYDVAVLEHFWTAAYLEEVAPCTDQVVLDLHNVESALYRSYAATARRHERWMFRQFHEACLAKERKWLPVFDLLLAASDHDAERLKDLSPVSRIEVVPNTIPFVPQPGVAADQAIVFSGNLRYRPNLDAARFFREQVWPSLREKWPALVWRIVGKNPEAVRRFVDGDDRIQLVGPVEDAVGVLARAQVAVAPILAGSGTRVKILEAWAAGRAVVSTSLGAEGLGAEHAKHLLIADGNQDFAEAVSSLLKSNSLRQQLGSCGRHLFETRFTWGAAWSRLEEIGI